MFCAVDLVTTFFTPSTLPVVGRDLPGSTSIQAEALYVRPAVRPVICWWIDEAFVPSSATCWPLSRVAIVAPPVAFQAARLPALKPGSFRCVLSPQAASRGCGAATG